MGSATLDVADAERRWRDATNSLRSDALVLRRVAQHCLQCAIRLAIHDDARHYEVALRWAQRLVEFERARVVACGGCDVDAVYAVQVVIN